MHKPIKLLISALEPSANLHLEPLLSALGSYEIFGIFDESLGNPILPSKAFSIMGFVDAISKIKKLKSHQRYGGIKLPGRQSDTHRLSSI